MPKCLVVGGDGIIGSSLSVYLRSLGYSVTKTSRLPNSQSEDTITFDLADETYPSFSGMDYAFICAGITNMDACEADPESTRRINVVATNRLIKHLTKLGCVVTYISSNTVFDGSSPSYSEDQKTQVANAYGRQKVEVEQYMTTLGDRAKVVRITKLLSAKTPIVERIIDSLQKGQHVEVFNDLNISPISLKYLCAALHKIATARQGGIFHVSGEENITYADFAARLAGKLNFDAGQIKPVESPPELFKPRYANLGMPRTIELVGIAPEPVNSVLEELENNEQWKNVNDDELQVPSM